MAHDLVRPPEVTGLIPVEYPTTAMVGATPQACAADINAAFADPAIRAIMTVVGGEDQITVIPHLAAGLAQHDPKPFLGTSDNTNIHHWLWANGDTGPARTVTGRTWGGCLEIIEWILTVGRFPFTKPPGTARRGGGPDGGGVGASAG